MKCPKCGAWNRSYFTTCFQCGAPLPMLEEDEPASWEASLHDKKPSLVIVKYDDTQDETLLDPEVPEEIPSAADAAEQPVDRAALTEEVEELIERREAGKRRLQELRERAEDVRSQMLEAEVIRPRREAGDDAYGLAGGLARNGQDRDAAPQKRYVYTDHDSDAPVYLDGYAPEDAASDESARYTPPRRSRQAPPTIAEEDAVEKKRRSRARVFLRIVLVLVLLAAFAAIGLFAARFFVIRQGAQVRRDNDAYAECFVSEYEGHPAHTLVVHGKENATVYLRETQSTYVVADGVVSVTIPDYMWYDTDSSTYAVPAEGDTMDVVITPYIRYSQEGEQYEMDPIRFTIDVPLSPVYLLNPATSRMEVGVSIFEVRINVQAGSTVIIDGTNVSTLIRETGNVSKNVQVLPVGDNTISISVKSKYCRENKLEVVLYRAPQEIPLELVPTVITEWNYEADDPVNQASISGSTLPGATITVESPHEDLVVNNETGDFKFKPLFPLLGNNEVVIRASYEGRADSVITHTVYYMPTADVYTRRAWDLDSQYSDLINYISIRKGTIYVGTGVITRIISSAPQMAVMNIGTTQFDKLVLLENSSKTTWAVGTRYRIYGEAYGLYDTMPRLTVRYTYLEE